MRIIAGKYGHRRFDVPRNIQARPTTDFARENIFNVIGNIIDFEGLNVLDLFAGTGAISIEFLSRGAKSVTAVEMAALQSKFIRSCAEKLGDSNLKLIRGDVFRYISGGKGGYDIVFADPPYDNPRIAELPDLILSGDLLKPGGMLILEHGKTNSFAEHPLLADHRVYGSVNFSIFRKPTE